VFSAAWNSLADGVWEDLSNIAGRLEEVDRRRAGWGLVRFPYAEKLMTVIDLAHRQRLGRVPA
jgi:hypothetical protein